MVNATKDDLRNAAAKALRGVFFDEPHPELVGNFRSVSLRTQKKALAYLNKNGTRRTLEYLEVEISSYKVYIDDARVIVEHFFEHPECSFVEDVDFAEGTETREFVQEWGRKVTPNRDEGSPDGDVGELLEAPFRITQEEAFSEYLLTLELLSRFTTAKGALRRLLAIE